MKRRWPAHPYGMGRPSLFHAAGVNSKEYPDLVLCPARPRQFQPPFASPAMGGSVEAPVASACGPAKQLGAESSTAPNCFASSPMLRPKLLVSDAGDPITGLESGFCLLLGALIQKEVATEERNPHPTLHPAKGGFLFFLLLPPRRQTLTLSNQSPYLQRN